MKTTNKYSAKLSQTAADSDFDTHRKQSRDSVPLFPRDIVMMRIRHIFKAAREV